MLSRESRPSFGAISSSFAAFPLSTEDDSRHSAVAISFRGLLWFLFLPFVIVLAVAQATAASDRSPATAGPQPWGPATKVRRGASIETPQDIHVQVDLALVNLTATDPYDRPVPGLDSSNLRV